MAGSNGVHAVHSGPVPAGAVLHAVVLLPDAEHRMAEYLANLPTRTPGLTAGPWTAIERPRPCTWCDLEGGGWSFRLVFDPREWLPGKRSKLSRPATPAMNAKWTWTSIKPPA